MLRLKSIVGNTNTTAGKLFDLSTQMMIVISLILFTIETIPELRGHEAFFKLVEYLIVAFFTVEYMLRVLVADRKLGYILSFYGIIDLVSILPFFLTLGLIDLRFVRVFRLFRLLRIFKFNRYTRALHRLALAFADVKEELILYTILTFLLIYLASVGIYYTISQKDPRVFFSPLTRLYAA